MKIDQDTVVVITGGSAGVGRAAARQFARAGARVAVLARDPARLILGWHGRGRNTK